jgi:putative transposase
MARALGGTTTLRAIPAEFVERLWRTIKYEEVYLRAYASVSEARASLGRYIDGFYNTRRLHSSLDRLTPNEVYFTALPSIPMAA